MPLILDIETVPTEAGLALPYPEADRNPPANYKSDEAIAKWRAADRERWAAERAKDCSLNPRLGRVLCIGLVDTLMPKPRVLMAYEPEKEALVLAEFWGLVEDHHGRVVTWNGSWDLQFLVTRSMLYFDNVTIPGNLIGKWFGKYRYWPHFDCKAALTQWAPPRAGEGLHQWAEYLGVEGKLDGLSGADVYPLYLAGHFDEIAAYCAADVKATQNIFRKIAPFFPSFQSEVPDEDE